VEVQSEDGRYFARTQNVTALDPEHAVVWGKIPRPSLKLTTRRMVIGGIPSCGFQFLLPSVVLILRLAPHVRGSLSTVGTTAVNGRKL
jgi:hypothetical protein